MIAAYYARVIKSKRAIFFALLSMIGIVYSPVMFAYFNADDFHFVEFAQREFQSLMRGEHWDAWFLGGVENYAVFRPIGRLFWLTNYIAFAQFAPGYHIAAIVFQIVASFAVFILADQLTRNRATAIITALIFAILPMHAEAVAWIAANYDVLSGMYFLIALVFYIFYMQKRAVRFYWIAFGAFLLAIGSKETSITLPITLLLYDFFFHPDERTRILQVAIRYMPFWIVFAARFIFFGHGYRGLTFMPEGWLYYLDFNLLRVFVPIITESSDLTRGLALVITLGLLFAFRFRPTVVFGLIWIPITLIPTMVGGVSDRSFYIPSFGVALLIAIMIESGLVRRARWMRGASGIALTILVLIYGADLFTRNQAYARASFVAEAILDRVQELHPTYPSDARFVFTGVPNFVPEGPPVFSTGLSNGLKMVYRDRNLRVFNLEKYPIWVDALDHAYFFQVDHRRVIERAEIARILEERKQCEDFNAPYIVWNFGEGVQNWEEWNDLERFEIRDGALATRALGNDPFMVSPEFTIPAIAIGDIEITMRVRADQSIAPAQIFWLATGQADFQPGLSVAFVIQPDGEFHTYRINPAQTGALWLGDQITRLRFDPIGAPGDIAIKTIRVLTHCSNAASERCECVR